LAYQPQLWKGSLVAAPTREERAALAQALDTILEHTETITAAAARRGVSHQTVRRQMHRGEVDGLIFGRDVRIWLDA
jgi:hypothetical protein